MPSSAYHDGLRQQRADAVARMRTLVDNADPRGLTATEKRALERDDALVSRYDDELRKLTAASAAIDGTSAHIIAGASASGTRRSATMSNDFGALQALVARARDGNAGYMASYLTAEALEARALQSAGGSAIETSFADKVFRYERTLNPIIGLATVLSNATGAPVTVPRLTADASVGGTATAEAAGITVADPTISSVTITPEKRGAITNFSYELFADEIIGVENLVAEAIARPVALGFGTEWTTGSSGVVTNGQNGGTAAGTANGASSWTFFGPPDLANLLYGLAAPYRQNATFMVSSDSMAKIAAFRDANNFPVMAAGFAGGPPTIFGRPIIENPALAAAGSASKSVLVGDFSKFVVVRGGELRIETSNEFKWSTDEISVRVLQRAAGALVDTAAVRYLVSANT